MRVLVDPVLHLPVAPLQPRADSNKKFLTESRNSCTLVAGNPRKVDWPTGVSGPAQPVLRYHRAGGAKGSRSCPDASVSGCRIGRR